MSVIDTGVLPASRRPKNKDGEPSLSPEQPYGPWLCRGEKVSVFYDCLKPNIFPEHHHKQAELFLTFDAAQAEITWRGKAGLVRTQTMNAHQFCLIPPNVPHTCAWKIEASVVVVYIEDRLLKEHVKMPLDTVIVNDFQPLTRLDTCLWSLGVIFRELCRNPDTAPASFIEGIGTALVSRTLEQYFRAGRHSTRQPRLSRGALRQMMEYIDANISGTITVSDLARHGALGVYHFSKLLKGSTGTSPRQFLLKYRVEKALELLRTGEFRLAEAAYAVGFCDQSHLHRHCQKFFGFPPRSVMRAAKFADSLLKKPETSKIFEAALG